MATFHREGELKRALASLAQQTYPQVEVILVDDNGDS
ncbi:MAG: glycosyltransferase family A protein, partial [Bacillota bacterium]|nr:glycosyltransferase family A protein [Bacillota bacterium]